MKKKSLLYVLMAVLGVVSFAGIYDAVITGRLGQIVIDGPPGYNAYTGVVRKVVPLVDVSLGDAVYISTSTGLGYPRVGKADSDDHDTVGDILIMVSDADSGGIALALDNGVMQSTGYDFTSAGLLVYVSNTEGLLTTTEPTTTGKYKQVIGYTESGNVIRVKPAPPVVIP